MKLICRDLTKETSPAAKPALPVNQFIKTPSKGAFKLLLDSKTKAEDRKSVHML